MATRGKRLGKTTSAGRSAAHEGVKRSRAVGRLQGTVALIFAIGALIAMGIFAGWKVTALALAAFVIFAGLVWQWNRFQAWRNPRKASRKVSESWRRGSIGEELTAAVLAKLSAKDYLVLHDVALGSAAANVDHVVIGPTGVFVLDSKNWNGRAVLKGRKGWVYGVPLTRTAASTAAERDWVVRALGDAIIGWDVPVYGAWVMTATRQNMREIDGIDVISLDQLLTYVTARRPALHRRQVESLAREARQNLRSA